MTSLPQTPQIVWPPTVVIADGVATFATVEQDSHDDLKSSARLLCDLRPDQLEWAPEAGITDPMGTADPAEAAEAIEADLRRLEPRPAGGIDVEVLVDETGDRNLRLRVNV